MPQVTGMGTTANLPNYAGDLFTADAENTPLLSMIGGMTGGMQTSNYEFPTAVLYDYPAPKQPSISEEASVTAPAGQQIARAQEKNVVQIHQDVIEITYAKQSNGGRMSGLNTAGQQANPANEKAWQIQRKLVQIARDIEYSFIQGTYANSGGASDVANKTRGMIELCATGNTIAAAGGQLTKAMIDNLLRTMATNGAYFNNMVIFAPAYQKQMITNVYNLVAGYNLPPTRDVGGLNISTIETDFANAGVVWSRFMPDDTLLVADVAHVAPVFQPVPDKGNFFEEELSKDGAADRIQIYGQIGLAHGPAFLHGTITGLATAPAP